MMETRTHQKRNSLAAVLSSMKRRLGRRSESRPYSEFISLKETLKQAEAAGLSVSEYLERRYPTGSRSALDQTMDGLESLGVFERPLERVCEIGPGSGRYLEKTAARLKPKWYEIYETSREWRDWLVQQYGVTARACDGRSLSQTESDSVDLVQAHKVFGGGLPFLPSVAYMREMARVARAGGWIVFDIMTETCFTQEQLDAWFAANPWNWAWSPHMMARGFTLKLFADQGISLIGNFQVPSYPGVTECMVFRKVAADSTPADLKAPRTSTGARNEK